LAPPMLLMHLGRLNASWAIKALSKVSNRHDKHHSLAISAAGLMQENFRAATGIFPTLRRGTKCSAFWVRGRARHPPRRAGLMKRGNSVSCAIGSTRNLTE